MLRSFYQSCEYVRQKRLSVMGDSERREKTTKLLEYFNDRIEIEPNEVALYVFRSACHEELGNYKMALDDALMIIDLDQSYWKGHHQALNIQIKLGIAGEEEIPEHFATKKSFMDLIEKRDQMKMITPDRTTLQALSIENKASLQLASPAKATEKTSSNNAKRPPSRSNKNQKKLPPTKIDKYNREQRKCQIL